MSLVINAPFVEQKLQSEAAKRGLTPEEYAETILATHLQSDAHQDLPFHATATKEEWKHAFDAWIDSHPVRKPLPDAALSRESMYEGDCSRQTYSRL